MKFRVKIDRERCKGCEFCVTFCPKNAIRMSGGLNSMGYHYAEVADAELCTGCAQCALMCPDVAIEIEAL